MADLIIFGTGGQGRSVIDIVESSGSHQIRYLVDLTDAVSGDVCGYPVLTREKAIQALLEQQSCEVFVAVGDNFRRQRLVQKIQQQVSGARFATLIHERAYVSRRASIGAGTAVMAGAVVNACSKIGCGVIVNTNASVDHDGIVGDFASLAPGVALGGGVTIGQRTFLGLGAHVIHGLRLGDDVCVGAGSLVLQSIEQGCALVYGVPAKIIRSRKPDEACL